MTKVTTIYNYHLYPEREGLSEILPETMISSLRRFCRNRRAGGIQMLYYTEKILGFEKKKSHLIFKTNNAKSRLFGELERGCLAWLSRMTFHPILRGQNFILWSYSPLRSYPRIRGRFCLKSHAHVV